MKAVTELMPEIGIAGACLHLGVSRASWYRHYPKEGPSAAPPPSALPPPEPAPRRSFRALSPEEEQTVADCLHSKKFQDCAPAAIASRLLDDGIYLCSPRTMYRILDHRQEVRERRDQRIHPAYTKPELLATGPNQLWSWDITKLRGPQKYTYYSLYVILDVFSRYVTGWMVAPRENADLAKEFIEETVSKYDIPPGQLNLHADRGKVMRSKTVYQMLDDLGVAKTHSRPYVSNDNPYSESQFRTLKYRPEFPDRFGCCEDSRAFCHQFFPWYNLEHRHSGIAMLTPAMVHFGEADEVLALHQTVLDEAYQLHPERFVRRPPKPKPVPTKVWINPPAPKGEQT